MDQHGSAARPGAPGCSSRCCRRPPARSIAHTHIVPPVAAKLVLAAVIATLASTATAHAQATNIAPFSYMLDAGLLHAAPPPPTASASMPSATSAQATQDVRFGPRQAVPQLPCRP